MKNMPSEDMVDFRRHREKRQIRFASCFAEKA